MVAQSPNWFSVVDEYLYRMGDAGLDDVLASGCLSGHVPASVAAYASIEAERVEGTREADGGISEAYRGVLAVEGVRYAFSCQLFIEPDGGCFLSDVQRFVPLEWQASICVA